MAMTPVTQALPTEQGWYLVYAPGYTRGSSAGHEKHDGILFSKYTITKAGKRGWSVELAGWNGNCVRAWAPIPQPPEEVR